MGEQGTYSSNPVYLMIMRNSRGKLFIYVSVLGVLCFFVFLLSSSHTSLKELEGINEKCQQQRDSLSAQLQVVYEHKNRLEKSLQQEKTDHKHTKEITEKEIHELEIKLQEEKDKSQKLETQTKQLKSSYSVLEEEKAQAETSLKEQLKNMQEQKSSEIEKLQNHISELLAEKDKLEVSNNAFSWKIEQHASELNLCHLQHEHTKQELNSCQAQLQTHNQNVAEPLAVAKLASSKGDVENETNKRDEANEHPEKKSDAGPELNANENKLMDEPPENVHKETNKTVPLNDKDKPVVLEKPHIMPPINQGDGVLPQPLPERAEDANRDIDAAVELPDKESNKHLSNRIDERDVESKMDLVNEDNNNKEKLKFGVPKEHENHPQVAAPNNFDNVGERDDHAAERGEDGLQYNLGEAKQQVELPVFNSKFRNRPKSFIPQPQNSNNDIAAAQMQDMMNKSPGDVNRMGEQNVLHMPPQGLSPIENKIREFRNAEFPQRGGDVHHLMDDKIYEEDDDDRENDDEPVNGPHHGIKAHNALPDNDFEDQDNVENAREEEGVVVAPK